jgi:hypothetical protein
MNGHRGLFLRQSYSKKFIPLIALIVLAGCQSLVEQVAELSSGGYFTEALTVIQNREADVAKNPRLKQIQEIKEARDLFAIDVYSAYKAQVDENLSGGLLRAAYRASADGLKLCSWHQGLIELTDSLKERVAYLDLLAKKWNNRITEGALPAQDARIVLQDISVISSLLTDSPDLQHLRVIARDTLAGYWSDIIRTTSYHLDAPSYALFIADLKNILGDLPRPSPFQALAEDVYSIISRDSDVRILSDEKISGSITDLMSRLYGDGRTSIPNYLTSINDSLQDSFTNWCTGELAIELQSAEPNYAVLDICETFLPRIRVQSSEDPIYQMLARAYITKAKNLLAGGSSVSLAYFYLQRASALASTSVNKEVEDLRKRTASVLALAKRSGTTLSITINPSIDLFNQAFTYQALSGEILGRTREDRPWKLVGADRQDADVRVVIEDAESYIPDYNRLNSVVSQYLSHYQDVPNPRKAALKSQLNWADYQVSSAKSSYESAVRNYNWNPNSYSLTAMNNAYNHYKYEVDSYNNLVSIYNWTPSTVSEAVYLPYTYKEGRLDFGWRLRVSVAIAGKTVTYSEQSVNSEYVRVGSKFSDKNEGTRRDVLISYQVSFDAFTSHLDRVVSTICDELGPLLLDLPSAAYTEISPEEIRILGFLNHPWGLDATNLYLLRISDWAEETLRGIQFAEVTPALATTKITRSALKVDVAISDEKKIAILDPLVCEIQSLQDGRTLSSGSGVLIDRNGLILTCAHVLNTATTVVVFSTGMYKGTYPADEIIVNEKRDVALIHAKGLQNTSWASLRLQGQARKGESIIAIGNPVIGGGGQSHGGATVGIVSNPSADLFGQTMLVADITVASGSSGGPLFSKESGEIIGVVLAVTEAGIGGTGGTSSGFYCLAAPATQLSNWLGIAY